MVDQSSALALQELRTVLERRFPDAIPLGRGTAASVGTARTFGLYAVFVQAVPFALLHLNKPLPEALLSIVGGVALGALVWRCRSFWIAVPIHAAQMLVLDFWCTLRIRTGVSGVGPAALVELVRAWLGE